MSCELALVTWPPLRLARMRRERGSRCRVTARPVVTKPRRRGCGSSVWTSPGVRRSGGARGRTLIRLGRIDLKRDRLARFAGSLTSNDHVVIEATGNAAVAEVLRPHVGRVIVANPKQVRLIGAPRSRPTGSTRSFWRSSMPVASCPRSDPGREDARLAQAGDSPQPARRATEPAQEHRAVDPARAPGPRRVRRLTCSARRGGSACPAGTTRG